MKVLVTTKRTQGHRPDDFSYTINGELARLPTVVCDCPDCGCERAVEGLASHKATTTFTVADRLDLDPAGYRRILRDHLVDGGWVVGDPDHADNAWVTAFVDEHLGMAAQFEIGDVLEIRDGQIRARLASSGHKSGP